MAEYQLTIKLWINNNIKVYLKSDTWNLSLLELWIFPVNLWHALSSNHNHNGFRKLGGSIPIVSSATPHRLFAATVLSYTGENIFLWKVVCISIAYMGVLQQKLYKYILVKFLGSLPTPIIIPTTRWSRYLGKGDDTLNRYHPPPCPHDPPNQCM